MIDVRNEIPKSIKEIENNLDEFIFWYTKEKLLHIIKKEEKKMKKLLTVTLLALVFLILNGNTVSVDAAQIDGTGLEDMGEYTVTQTVMQRVRVYIDENQVEFIQIIAIIVVIYI